MNQNEHVYCVDCENFKMHTGKYIEDYYAECPFEKECCLWEFEDSKPFSERPCYKPMEKRERVYTFHLDETKGRVRAMSREEACKNIMDMLEDDIYIELNEIY